MTDCVVLRHEEIIESLARAEGQLSQLSSLRNTDDKLALITRIDRLLARMDKDFQAFRAEVRTLPVEQASAWRKNVRAVQESIKTVTRELTWAKTEVGEALIPEERVDTCVVVTEKSLIDYGKGLMGETESAGDRTIRILEDTKVVGQDTAAKLKLQTEQLGVIHDEAYAIEDNVERSLFLAKRMGRRLATDKLIWLMSFLIILALIFILFWQVIYPRISSSSSVSK